VSEASYEQANLRFVGACAAIAAGLAIAGSLDRSTGGVIVLLGWVAGIATLHRLGRAGSVREPEKKKAEKKKPSVDVASKDDDADVGS